MSEEKDDRVDVYPNHMENLIALAAMQVGARDGKTATPYDVMEMLAHAIGYTIASRFEHDLARTYETDLLPNLTRSISGAVEGALMSQAVDQAEKALAEGRVS